MINVPPPDEDDADFAGGGEPDRLLEPRPLTRPLAVGAAVLFIAIAAAGAFWAAGRNNTPTDVVQTAPTTTETLTTAPLPEPPPSPQVPTTGPADIRAQAQALNKLLSASKKSRDKLNQGIKTAGRCGSLPAALTLMRQAGDERRAEQSALAALDLSAIPQGDRARAALNDALGYSVAADEEYVKWAETKRGNGCRNSATAQQYYDAGTQQSSRAGAAKQRFLDLWNPVAVSVGLPARDRQGI